MIDHSKSFWTDESGVAMPEYALILALLCVGLLVVMVIFRDSIAWVFERIGDVLTTEAGSIRTYTPGA